MAPTAALLLLVAVLVACNLELSTAARGNNINKDHPLLADNNQLAASMMPALDSLSEAVQQINKALLAVAPDLANTDGAPTNAEPAHGRMLLANVTQQKQASRVNLLASDAFSMVYTGGNFARAIFGLMGPAVLAGQTGTITIDAMYLLNLNQLLGQYVATLGDLLSKGARFTADGIAPI